MSPEELRQQIAEMASRIIAGTSVEGVPFPMLPDIEQDGALIADAVLTLLAPPGRHGVRPEPRLMSAGEYPCPKCGCRTKRIMCGDCWRSEFPGVSQAVRPVSRPKAPQ